MDTQQEQIKEEWRPVVGYEGLYEVSNLGNIASLHYKKKGERKLRKLKTKKNGYMEIGLSKDSKMKSLRVHRVVAMAFIPNPDNLPCINHKDENKLNNAVENLEWCTVKYNTNYGTALVRRSQKSSIPVIKMTKDGLFLERYESIQDASRQTGVGSGDITTACKGKSVTAHGYKWRYADDVLYKKALARRKKIVDDYTSRGVVCSRDNIRPVLQYTLDGAFVCEYQTIKDAERNTGVGYGSIWQCCHNKIKKTRDYIFKYKDK